jgi:hypothetical protein
MHDIAKGKSQIMLISISGSIGAWCIMERDGICEENPFSFNSFILNVGLLYDKL